MDRFAAGYSCTFDTDLYEYRGDNFLPINIDALGHEGAVLRSASASLDSEQLSLQGASSQQSLFLQNLYRTSSQQSSLTSSQGVGVSTVFLCPSQNMTGLWHRNMGFCVNRFTRGSLSICLLTGVMYVCFFVF